MNVKLNEYESYQNGYADGRRMVRQELADALTKRNASTIAQHNTAYQQALDDVADALNIRTKTTVRYVA